ncbi:MoaB/Mog domain-containing protein [Dichotomocladium elegans]|nr:MoaB/Mog domain-containing protein [Dichotomocladium elegans]
MTAACCIIGDEILNGRVKDTNSHFLAKFLFKLGIELKRVEVVGDDVEDIGSTVRRLSSMHDLVFTSGGIGVTHDDVSYQAIASAYGLELRVDADTYQRVQMMMMAAARKHWDDGCEKGGSYERLAMLPWPAELLRPRAEMMIPVVVVNRNIYMLPGVPKLFETLVELLHDRLVLSSCDSSDRRRRFYRSEVATKAHEITIAASLASIQDRVRRDGIKIGSYPLWGNADASVVVSVVGKDEHAVNAVAAEVAKEIGGWEYHPARL